jgi:hypothetical protein
VFSRRVSASSMCSFSLKWRIRKGSPGSGRIEGSSFRTLAQNLRNVKERGTPSPSLVDSYGYGSLILSFLFSSTGSNHNKVVQYDTSTYLSLECLSHGIKGKVDPSSITTLRLIACHRCAVQYSNSPFCVSCRTACVCERERRERRGRYCYRVASLGGAAYRSIAVR